MKQRTALIRTCAAVLVMVLFLMAKSGWAVTHVVQFGGNLGYVYSPSDFSAMVGDTVEWEGDFSMHPLSSTTIPTGAQSWNNTSGTTFLYVIKVSGTYHYQCDIHYSIGMIGSFEAAAAGVREGKSFGAAGKTDFVAVVKSGNIAGPELVFLLPLAGHAKIEVFDMLGRPVATVANQPFGAGTHSLALDMRRYAAGLYFVKLTAGGVERVVTIRVPDR
ncbi:MAG TPA: T9SS type A sorting domain-containing protein [Chitinivibrionales bacterium]|jgi:plastocyanin|nr:T9SS type A sorting domain-containing protein [Chitinivibrionales bacterium]